MFGDLGVFLLSILAGFGALVTGLLLSSSEWLEKQRYLLPALGLLICYSGFAFLGILYLLLTLSVPLVVGLWARNRHLVLSGSLLLWITSVLFNSPLTTVINPPPGPPWTLLGFLTAIAGFFLVLTPFAWDIWGGPHDQEHLRGTINRNES